MSISGLIGIYSLLPEERQKRAILSALDLMLAEGQWGEVQNIAAQAMEAELDENFRASILATGIKTTIRLREFERAFEQYELFSAFKSDTAIHLLQADVLYQLAIQILPRESDRLYALLKQLLYMDMPMELQRSLAETGLLLAQTFSKNRDSANLAAVKADLKKYLAEPVYKSLAYKLP